MFLNQNISYLGCGCVNKHSNSFCSRSCLKYSYEYLDPSDIDYKESNLTLKKEVMNSLFSSGQPLKMKKLIPIIDSFLGCDIDCISVDNHSFCGTDCRNAAIRDHYIGFDDLSNESNLTLKPKAHERLFKK